MVSDAAAAVAGCVAVHKSYAASSGRVQALTDISLEVPRGRVTVLAGSSGSGKSTLLRLLALLDRPDQGRVVIAGRDLQGLGARERRRLRATRISYLFQRPTDNLLPYLTVREQLDLAAQLRGVPTPRHDELLTLLGLTERRDALPRTLSGGEQQRVAFAAAVVGDPALILADEPTAELDRHNGTILMTAVRALAERGQSVVLASHDDVVLDAADVIVRLRHGRHV